MAREPEDPPLSEQVRFFRQATEFGWMRLLRTKATLAALFLASPFVLLVFTGELAAVGVQTVAVAFLGIGIAVFGIALAGLAIVGGFFDRSYAAVAHRAGLLRDSLFLFWWVAAAAVFAICAATGALLVSLVSECEALLALVVGASAACFFYALFAALSLVGHLMRQAMYRAAVEEAGLSPGDIDPDDRTQGQEP